MIALHTLAIGCHSGILLNNQHSFHSVDGNQLADPIEVELIIHCSCTQCGLGGSKPKGQPQCISMLDVLCDVVHCCVRNGNVSVLNASQFITVVSEYYKHSHWL